MERVTFRNSRGLNLVGILHTPERPTKKAVIIAHGFTSDKTGSHEKIPKLAQRLEAIGIAVLRFDFSGCGESDPDTITVAKEVDDLRSAILFMRGKGYTEIALVGSSLGGLISILSYDKDIYTLVLWAPVTTAKVPSIYSTKEVKEQLDKKGFAMIKNARGVEHKIERLYVNERKGVDREKILSAVKKPVMIIHGDADDIVPVQDSREAIKLLPKGSKLEIIEGGNHFFTGKVDEVIGLTVKWLEKF
ncbi:MAG: alpha/beta hydrolase [Candidatus Aenigmarchaeota archaeon]|nr:alpha/beta hydrolase [Candidatus Aenigmarchaeota archaeon]